MIARRLLFGNPDKALPALSPDGQHLGFLAPRDGVLNVFVGPPSDAAAASPLTHDRERGIRAWRWAHTGRHLLYLQDTGGDEDWHVYSVELASRKVVDLTPIEGISARIERVSRTQPREIVLGINDREAALHDVYRVDVETGERTLILENPGFAGVWLDADYRVRLAVAMQEDGGLAIHRFDGEGGFSEFQRIGPEDALTTQIFAFDGKGKRAFLVDSRGRDTGALVALDLETGESDVLFASDRADVADVLVHPTTREVQAAAFTVERTHWEVLDPSIAGDFEVLAALADGEPDIDSRTDDDSRWLVSYLMDDGPVRTFLYDRPRKESTFLFAHKSELAGVALAKMHPVTLRSRDGLDLVSYLSLPRAAQRASSPGRAGRIDRPEAPLPMVLFVHGGPWGRDAWGFEPHHQLFADRGYATLAVNFRGSMGFGKRFVNAGDKEWGRRMHEDLLDAVAWAVGEGIADPSKIAIAGGSYGGYAALAGLTLTPEVFACGVDIVGPSNLVTLLESIPPYWAPQIELFKTRVGDHTTQEGREFLRSRSPLTFADRIEKPLLIAQGANDPRVKRAESDQIVAAMQERGIPVTYILYPDEGHGFARPENSLSFMAVTEAFLAQHLGGDCEPIGDAFVGANLEVLAGAEQIPGLARALGDG